MAHDPVETWKNMKIRVWEEDYYLISLDNAQAELATTLIRQSSSNFCSITKDQFGFSVVVDARTWSEYGNPDQEADKFGPLKVISTDSDLPFDVPGFIKTALAPINERGLKAAPICGLKSDHFFTGAEQLNQVVAQFEAFSAGQWNG